MVEGRRRAPRVDSAATRAVAALFIHVQTSIDGGTLLTAYWSEGTYQEPKKHYVEIGRLKWEGRIGTAAHALWCVRAALPELEPPQETRPDA